MQLTKRGTLTSLPSLHAAAADRKAHANATGLASAGGSLRNGGKFCTGYFLLSLRDNPQFELASIYFPGYELNP